MCHASAQSFCRHPISGYTPHSLLARLHHNARSSIAPAAQQGHSKALLTVNYARGSHVSPHRGTHLSFMLTCHTPHTPDTHPQPTALRLKSAPTPFAAPHTTHSHTVTRCVQVHADIFDGTTCGCTPPHSLPAARQSLCVDARHRPLQLLRCLDKEHAGCRAAVSLPQIKPTWPKMRMKASHHALSRRHTRRP